MPACEGRGGRRGGSGLGRGGNVHAWSFILHTSVIFLFTHVLPTATLSLEKIPAQVARVLARCATYGAFERSPYRNSRITHAMTPWNQDPQGAFLRCHSSSHALGSVRVLISMRPCHPSRDPPPRRARRAPRARDFVTRVCETIAAMRAHATQGGTTHVGHSAIVSTPS